VTQLPLPPGIYSAEGVAHRFSFFTEPTGARGRTRCGSYVWRSAEDRTKILTTCSYDVTRLDPYMSALDDEQQRGEVTCLMCLAEER
jgi:hypothetical protein